MTLMELLLSKLPDRYVDLVVNNLADRSYLFKEAMDIEVELLVLFNWEQSKEGAEFWSQVLDAITSNSKLPKLPLRVDYGPNTLIYANDTAIIKNAANSGINVTYDINLAKLYKSDSDKMESVFSWLN